MAQPLKGRKTLYRSFRWFAQTALGISTSKIHLEAHPEDICKLCRG